MREYFVQIVPGVSEIFIFCTKRRKIKQSRRANDAGNQKAVIRHTEFQSAERKKKIGYKTEKRNVDWWRNLPCGSDRPDLVLRMDRMDCFFLHVRRIVGYRRLLHQGELDGFPVIGLPFLLDIAGELVLPVLS